MVVLTSVVIDDLDVARIAALEAEDYPVLVMEREKGFEVCLTVNAN